MRYKFWDYELEWVPEQYVGMTAGAAVISAAVVCGRLHIQAQVENLHAALKTHMVRHRFRIVEPGQDIPLLEDRARVVEMLPWHHLGTVTSQEYLGGYPLGIYTDRIEYPFAG